MNSNMFDDMFLSDSKETKLSRALRTGDDEFIEEYTKQFESKKDNDLFKILDKITIEEDYNFDVNTVRYNKFIVEDMLSRSYNCLGIIFLLNLISDGLTNQQHYDYLVRNIPAGRKNYKDRTRVYLEEDARKMVIKILLIHVYGCNIRVAEDYYDVLVARNKVKEFLMQYRGFLATPEADRMMERYIKNATQRKEYHNIVHDILEGKID